MNALISFPNKMPFEDRVLDYLKSGKGKTIEQCAADLGISRAAVLAALASLESKGVVKYSEE